MRRGHHCGKNKQRNGNQKKTHSSFQHYWIRCQSQSAQLESSGRKLTSDRTDHNQFGDYLRCRWRGFYPEPCGSMLGAQPSRPHVLECFYTAHIHADLQEPRVR